MEWEVVNVPSPNHTGYERTAEAEYGNVGIVEEQIRHEHNAGDEQPRPMPDSASEPMITRSEEPGATEANASIEATTKTDPTTAELRSPTRIATYPASGPAIEWNERVLSRPEEMILCA